MQHITPCLWFDHQAEEAAHFYTSLVKNSQIIHINHYDAAAAAASGQTKNSVMTVAFELNGQAFLALNGGPHFKFTPATSFILNCDTQDEIDELWEKLSADGEQQQCGWLMDKYGLSWQVVPTVITQMMMETDKQKSARVMQAILKMQKIDIDTLNQAYSG